MDIAIIKYDLELSKYGGEIQSHQKNSARIQPTPLLVHISSHLTPHNRPPHPTHSSLDTAPPVPLSDTPHRQPESKPIPMPTHQQPMAPDNDRLPNSPAHERLDKRPNTQQWVAVSEHPPTQRVLVDLTKDPKLCFRLSKHSLPRPQAYQVVISQCSRSESQYPKPQPMQPEFVRISPESAATP